MSRPPVEFTFFVPADAYVTGGGELAASAEDLAGAGIESVDLPAGFDVDLADRIAVRVRGSAKGLRFYERLLGLVDPLQHDELERVLAAAEQRAGQERRRWQRRPTSLPVRWADLDAAALAVLAGHGEGEVIDLGPGGARLTSRTRLPAAVDPTLWFDLPGGPQIVALARVVDAQGVPGAGDEGEWTYSVAFVDLDDDGREALERFVSGGAGAGS